jgi:adenylate kinase
VRLVILGPQGAGKGTQSARLAEKYDIPAIATGDMFRWAISNQTDIGRKAEEYVQAGKLVPDDVTIEVVRERVAAEDCAGGFLLDGFPRSTAQAEALDDMLAEHGHKLDAALVIEVPEEVSLHRIMGRRVCTNCGRNYSVESGPRVDWTCDRCGGTVEARADDQDEAIIRQRLQQYYESTAPLKAHYDRLGLLRVIDGVGSPDEVFDRIVAQL